MLAIGNQSQINTYSSVVKDRLISIRFTVRCTRVHVGVTEGYSTRTTSLKVVSMKI